MEILYLIGVLFFLFIIGLPFVLIYKLIISRKKLKIDNKLKKINIELEHIANLEKNESENEKFSFMKDYQMWIKLTKKEKEERLTDIDVILKEGNDGIKKEMIQQGFPIGSKIIDISYFTGLSEHGTTITHFIIQHEKGGEIRELGINIDLADNKFVTTSNRYKSSGKERYHYLKKEKGLINI